MHQPPPLAQLLCSTCYCQLTLLPPLRVLLLPCSQYRHMPQHQPPSRWRPVHNEEPFPPARL